MEKLPTQIFCGPRPDQACFRPVTGVAGNGKPRGGFWTSTWETAFEDGWPWWCLRERYSIVETGWLMQPLPCRVLTISDKRSALSLMENYGINIAKQRRYELWLPDWARVARDFDAVRLTAPYDPELRFSTHPKIGINFYGWDCESTVWLSWQFGDDDPEPVDLSERAAAITDDD